MTDNPGKSKIAGIRVRRREPARVEEIPLARIQPSPLNPRRSMDEAELDDLAASMRAHGQLQPALVRPHPDGSPDGDALYEMVCGHRRRAAAERGGLPRLLCTIREMTDAQAVEAMLAENSKRADVAPLDESAALSRLVEWGESPADLADRLGRTSKWVRDRLALARLVDELRALLDQGAIGIGSAVVLAQIGADEQRAIANVIPRMWSTTTTDIRREVERRARNLAGAPWSLEAALADRQSCSNCSTRTDVQADLFAQDSGARCLDRSCWKAKGLAWADEQRAAGADVREEQVDYGGTLRLTDPVWWLPEELRQTPARELVPDVAPIIYIADGAVTVRLPHERVTQALAEHNDPEVAGAARERLERLRDYGAVAGDGDKTDNGCETMEAPRPQRRECLAAMGQLVESEARRAPAIDRPTLVAMAAALLDAAWAETRRAICKRRGWDKDALEQPYGETPRVEPFLADTLDDGGLWGLLIEIAFHRPMDGLRHSTAYDTNMWLRALDRAGVPRPPNAGEPVDEADAADPVDNWFIDHAEFFGNLPERSQSFLRLVHEHGELTITDALGLLGLSRPRDMGGVTGSIGRWCPVRGIPVPYSGDIVDGVRVWRWIGNGPA